MTSSPTPYEDLNVVLGELVTSARGVLKEDFVGAYLQGSFAVGDFDEHSDADFIVVVHQPPDQESVDALQEMHERIFAMDCPWAQYLEGAYFPRDILRPHDSCSVPLWYLDNGSRRLKLSTHDNTLVVRSILQRRGVLLAGPPADTLIDPVPVDALRQEIIEGSLQWGEEIVSNPESIDNLFFQSFAVLHFCRALHDVQAGGIHSKRTGTEWAKRNLDSSWSGLIDRSWAGRPSPEISSKTPADPAELALTIHFVGEALKKLREFRRDTGGDV